MKLFVDFFGWESYANRLYQQLIEINEYLDSDMALNVHSVQKSNYFAHSPLIYK